MKRWLLNGVAQALLSPDDRGLAYGDGLFETVAVRNGGCRFFDAHLARLADGCERLGIPLPATALLEAEAARLIGTDRDGVLRITITRGVGPRGYSPPAKVSPTRLLQFETAAPRHAPQQGVRVCYTTTRIAAQPATAGLKTLNRLEQVLARGEPRVAACDEGLMCDERGDIVCGTMSNVFAVRDGRLHTPDLVRCGVRGVMRSKAIAVAQAAGIEVVCAPLARDFAAAADDLFLTNSLIGVWPVAELEEARFACSAQTQAVCRGLAELGVEECRV